MKKFLTLAFWSILSGSITYLVALCISIILKADFWHILLSLTVFQSAELSYKLYARNENLEDSFQKTEEMKINEKANPLDLEKAEVEKALEESKKNIALNFVKISNILKKNYDK